MLLWLALAATPSSWLVLPAMGTHPPPSDPTLLRLSQSVAEDFSEMVDGPVRLVSREIRSQICRKGTCPKDTGALLRSDRVLELALSDDASKLEVTVHGRHEPLGQLTVDCATKGRQLVCRTAPLKKLIGELSIAAYDEKRVEARLDALRPKLRKCFGRKRSLADVRFRFKLEPNGAIRGVTVSPKAVGKSKAGRCAARRLEHERLPEFRGKGRRMKFSLLAPPDPLFDEGPAQD